MAAQRPPVMSQLDKPPSPGGTVRPSSIGLVFLWRETVEPTNKVNKDDGGGTQRKVGILCVINHPLTLFVKI